jgi:hypothetical protein
MIQLKHLIQNDEHKTILHRSHTMFAFKSSSPSYLTFIFHDVSPTSTETNAPPKTSPSQNCSETDKTFGKHEKQTQINLQHKYLKKTYTTQRKMEVFVFNST